MASSRFQTKRMSLPSTSPIVQKDSSESLLNQSPPGVSSPMASPSSCAQNPESNALEATMGSTHSQQTEFNSEILNENGSLSTPSVSSQFESNIPSSCGNDNSEKEKQAKQDVQQREGFDSPFMRLLSAELRKISDNYDQMHAILKK